MLLFWSSLSTKNKALLAGAAALFLALSTFVGQWAMRVKSESNSYSQVTKERDEAIQANTTLSHQISELVIDSSTKARTYEHRIAALNAKTGEALQDGHGNAIFNVEIGTESATQQLQHQYEETTAAAQRLSMTVQVQEKEIARLRTESSGPGFRWFNGGLSWDFPWDGLADTGRAQLGLYAGPNFLVGPLTLRSNIGVVLPPFSTAFDIKDTKGRLAVGTDF